MQHQLTAFFRRNVENYTEKKYVLAVSGGVDSMVLLNAMINSFIVFASCIRFQSRQSIGTKQKGRRLLKNRYEILDMISSAK